jgi:alanyl-tRNA synthetase
MTTRLYYHDSFLYDFDAEVREVLDSPRPALIIDRSAFYPTSGGQVFDTGWITTEANHKVKVTEVADAEDGRVVHYFEAERDFDQAALKPGTRVRGQIDPARRRDHMQQHSGQHVLSAAFIRLYNMPTVATSTLPPAAARTWRKPDRSRAFCCANLKKSARDGASNSWPDSAPSQPRAATSPR